MPRSQLQAIPLATVFAIRRPFSTYLVGRVRARPVADSDPVRHRGPQRGQTGGRDRPRSSPSGPPVPRFAALTLGGRALALPLVGGLGSSVSVGAGERRGIAAPPACAA